MKSLKNLSDLDGVRVELSDYVNRAVFIYSVMKNETDKINLPESKEWEVKAAAERTTVYSEIIFDYLWMLKEKVDELSNMVDKLYDCDRRGSESDENQDYV